jgi:hypothetical protein
MDKMLLSLTLVLVLVSFVSASPNPSAVYCEREGYDYVIREGPTGQYGDCCMVGDNETCCNAWDFLGSVCSLDVPYYTNASENGTIDASPFNFAFDLSFDWDVFEFNLTSENVTTFTIYNESSSDWPSVSVPAYPNNLSYDTQGSELLYFSFEGWVTWDIRNVSYPSSCATYDLFSCVGDTYPVNLGLGCWNGTGWILLQDYFECFDGAFYIAIDNRSNFTDVIYNVTFEENETKSLDIFDYLNQTANDCSCDGCSWDTYWRTCNLSILWNQTNVSTLDYLFTYAFSSVYPYTSTAFVSMSGNMNIREFSEIFDLIKSGASLGAVLSSWNPSASHNLEVHFEALFHSEGPSDLFNNGYLIFVDLFKYVFRQPASLVSQEAYNV